MRFLFDTNACISLLNESSQPMWRRVRRHAPSDFGISSIVAYELYYGAFKSQRRDSNVALLDQLAFEVVSFDAGDARTAGAIRSDLETTGRPIGPYDVLIAAQARTRELLLITANSREFARVDGLRWADWSLQELAP